jgi:hypothetical protein
MVATLSSLMASPLTLTVSQLVHAGSGTGAGAGRQRLDVTAAVLAETGMALTAHGAGVLAQSLTLVLSPVGAGASWC